MFFKTTRNQSPHGCYSELPQEWPKVLVYMKKRVILQHQEGIYGTQSSFIEESLLTLNCRLSLLWQDSLLSLCFDRLPAFTPSGPENVLPDKLSYRDAMRLLADKALRSTSTKRHQSSPDFISIANDVARLEDMKLKSGINSGNTGMLSIQERCESHALDLHISFVIAWICRPAVRGRHQSELRTPLQVQLVQKCNENLVECVRAYVQLHSMSIIATRSWTIIHNALSSALLLGLLGTAATDPEVRQLQGGVLDIFSAPENRQGNRQELKDDLELSPPHSRAVSVLKKLYNESTSSATEPAIDHAEQSMPNNQPPSIPNDATMMQYVFISWQLNLSIYLLICQRSGGYPTAAFPVRTDFAEYPPDNSGQMDMSPLDELDFILWGE
jgi:hypothetical protein